MMTQDQIDEANDKLRTDWIEERVTKILGSATELADLDFYAEFAAGEDFYAALRQAISGDSAVLRRHIVRYARAKAEDEFDSQELTEVLIEHALCNEADAANEYDRG